MSDIGCSYAFYGLAIAIRESILMKDFLFSLEESTNMPQICNLQRTEKK